MTSMTKRLMLPLALVALLLTAAASASAASRYKVGIGDQSATVFSDPLFTALKLKRIRYIVPWNWNANAGMRTETAAFVDTARAAGFEPFIHFSAARGCWTGARYKKTKACKAPSNSAFKKSFKAFRKAFPTVKVFGAWNEANHKSQPTYKSPKRAAGYYNTLRSACPKCTIVALDLLDSSNLTRYYRSFRRYAKKSPRIWGLHNYSDVNRSRAIKTQELLRQAPGEVWLTETGGIVSFTKKFPYSPKRAKARTAYMFKLADTYSRKRRGYSSRITRIYPYQYSGGDRTERFDAGLVNPNRTARPAYKTFKAALRMRST